MLTFDDQLTKLVTYLRQCNQKKLWGKANLQFVEGNIVEVQFTQTVKLEREKVEALVCVSPVAKSESP